MARFRSAVPANELGNTVMANARKPAVHRGAVDAHLSGNGFWAHAALGQLPADVDGGTGLVEVGHSGRVKDGYLQSTGYVALLMRIERCSCSFLRRFGSCEDK
jgi:hypothetical protein